MLYSQFGRKRGIRCDKSYVIKELSSGWYTLTIEVTNRVGDRLGGTITTNFNFASLEAAQAYIHKMY